MPIEKEYPKILTQPINWSDSLCEFPRLLQVYIKRNRDENILFRACKVGNIESVKIIISSGIYLFGNVYTISLPIACQYGHSDLVRFLVEKGADINPSNRDKPLSKASRGGYPNFWLNRELDQFTLISCEKGYLEIVRCILEIFNDLNQEQNALQIAIWNNHLPIVEFILDRGKVTLALESFGLQTDIGICNLLLDRGALVSSRCLELAEDYNRNDLVDLFKSGE